MAEAVIGVEAQGLGGPWPGRGVRGRCRPSQERHRESGAETVPWAVPAPPNEWAEPTVPRPSTRITRSGLLVRTTRVPQTDNHRFSERVLDDALRYHAGSETAVADPPRIGELIAWSGHRARQETP
ncbi:hypothetical protein FMUBM48_24550 [Nocardia cyriacigeorgica]|nr:hypothetical protein FMUBM48_24550 [Nocardia cyriacigeorgica]